LAVLEIRAATDSDRDAIWNIFHEVVGRADTYAIDPNISRDNALAYWFGEETRTYVAELDSHGGPRAPASKRQPRSDFRRLRRKVTSRISPGLSIPEEFGGGAEVEAGLVSSTRGVCVPQLSFEGSRVVGTYILRPNQQAGGSHVANAAFMVAACAQGRGIGRGMGEHCLAEARRLGFRAIQFNFVVSTNESAIHLWQQLGFKIVGTLPGAFRHPGQGYVDVYVMFRQL
jgi:ribosomal protein S18 acetylase RimI-like enzyme